MRFPPGEGLPCPRTSERTLPGGFQPFSRSRISNKPRDRFPDLRRERTHRDILLRTEELQLTVRKTQPKQSHSDEGPEPTSDIGSGPSSSFTTDVSGY
ncbi:hypothetical protein ACVW19_003448 [Streptomyces sp. TE5632]